MIEESLLKSNYLGKDGFIWWLGQVAPPESWDFPEKVDVNSQKYKNSWAYRCKVRIIGYHTYNRDELSDNDLPWAHVMLGNTDGNAQGGYGKTHKLVGGETVFGFFLDGDDAQQPVIVGSLYRNANVENFDIDEIAFKPFSGHSPGSRVSQGSTKQTIVTSKKEEPKVPTNPSADSNKIIGGRMKSPISSNFNTGGKSDLFFPFDKAMAIAYEKARRPTISSETGCDSNVIGKITRAIQNFIAVVSGLESYLDFYVDPVLNTFVDITREIKRTSTIILGSIKSIINNMRNIIMKMVGCLFSKFVGLVVPIPQQPIIGEATKNILNIIFCIFEKIIDILLPFLQDMLQGLVGRAINAPLCAIEEFTAAILDKLISIIDELLAPIMSGLEWLMNGASQIGNILSQAKSIATQIFNLIGCDNLKCETPSEWALAFGPSKSQYDNWNRTLGKMNVLRGFNDNLSQSIDSLSIFSGSNSGSPIFRDCSDRVKNPRTQDDLVNTGAKYPSCLPPEIKIYGDGIGAEAIAVMGENGSILSIEILNPGFGYSLPPTVNIVDKSNNGSGARAKAVISNGSVTQIYLVSSGSGYCATDLSSIVRSPYYIVTANKYSFYEGETCTFTINTQNVSDGTRLRYLIGGNIRQNDIVGPLRGSVVIFNNTASVSIKIRQDSSRETIEELIFDLLNSDQDIVARAIVLINDRLSPILQLSPNNSIQTPPGTTIPTGIGTVGFGTTTTTIGPGIAITTTGPGTGTTTTTGPGTGTTTTTGPGTGITSVVGPGIGTTSFFPPDVVGPGIGTTNVGILTSIVIDRPGLGYTTGDTINIGNCVVTPIVSPSGAIVGVNEVFCPIEFGSIPNFFINTQTGVGAELYPVFKYIPKQKTSTGVAINQLGSIQVVDCI